MRQLTRDQFEGEVERFDDLVARTRGVDQFCSSAAWLLPAHDAFRGDHDLHLLRGEHGYLCLASFMTTDGVTVWHPCESTWYLGSPVIGPQAEPLAAEVTRTLVEAKSQYEVCLLSGLEYGSPLLLALVQALAPEFTVSLGPTSRRRQADLTGGLDGWLERRTSGFRRNLGRAVRRAQDAGLRFEPAHPTTATEAEAVYARVQAVETRSWKGVDAVGITVDPMRSFYGGMLPRLAATKTAHVVFARHEGRDVGYVLGALWGRSYRGLQFAYDKQVAHLSVGNLLQHHVIAELAGTRCDVYDLGIDIAYKHRWGERALDTVMLALRP